MRSRDLLLADAHSADQLVVPLDVVLETLTSSKSLAAGAAFERLHLKNYYTKKLHSGNFHPKQIKGGIQADCH